MKKLKKQKKVCQLRTKLNRLSLIKLTMAKRELPASTKEGRGPQTMKKGNPKNLLSYKVRKRSKRTLSPRINRCRKASKHLSFTRRFTEKALGLKTLNLETGQSHLSPIPNKLRLWASLPIWLLKTKVKNKTSTNSTNNQLNNREILKMISVISKLEGKILLQKLLDLKVI